MTKDVAAQQSLIRTLTSLELQRLDIGSHLGFPAHGTVGVVSCSGYKECDVHIVDINIDGAPGCLHFRFANRLEPKFFRDGFCNACSAGSGINERRTHRDVKLALKCELLRGGVPGKKADLPN